MEITVDIPDPLLKVAKREALDEGLTLTDLLIEGLKGRIAWGTRARKLPVSTATGGLVPGVDWRLLRPVDPAGEVYR